jgi:hypothetical protein
MFEQLIRLSPENPVPFTVLSIQRRMRPNTADLTRLFYNEITTIIDHETCLTKAIGGSIPFGERKTPLIKRVEYKGREVPGVAPSIFFRQHTGSLTRAHVGLSKVNNLEADRVCSVANILCK